MLFSVAFAADGGEGSAAEEKSKPMTLTFSAELAAEYSTDRMEDAVLEQTRSVVEQRMQDLDLSNAKLTFPEDRQTVVIKLPAGALSGAGKTVDQITENLAVRGVVELRDADGKVLITNEEIQRAAHALGRPSEDAMENVHYAVLYFTDAGIQKFSDATKAIAARAEGKNTVHIFFDNEELTAQKVDEAVTGDSYTIAQELTQDEAEKLAFMSQRKPMPVSLKLVSAEEGEMPVEYSFPDIKGHWAEASLQRAVELGLIKGIGGKVMPDNTIKGAEAITILNRVLGGTLSDDISGMPNVPQNAWYADEIAKALHLGLVAANDARNFDNAFTRVGAFTLLTRAFVYDRAAADEGVLHAFTDIDSMSTEQRQAAAALIEAGIINGNTATTLAPLGKLTRAQFVTMLLRAVSNFPEDETTVTGGILHQDAETVLTDTQGADDHVFACGAETIKVEGGTIAGRLVLKGAEQAKLSVTGEAQVDTLAVDPAGAADVQLEDSAAADRLVIAGKGGAVRYHGAARHIEITASGRQIDLSGMSAQTLTITGSGNTIKMDGDVSAVTVGAGARNTALTMNGASDTMVVAGRGTKVEGAGKVGSVDIRSIDCTISVSADSKVENIDRGLDGVAIEMGVPTKVTPGGSLLTQVKFTGVTEEKICSAQWYQDGKPLAEYRSDHFVLTADKISRHTTGFTFTKDMKTSVTMGFKLTYHNPSTDETEELYVEKTVPIENYSKEWYYQRDANRVLKLVSSTYKGNYTTAYAVKNDYKPYEKEIWINAKGHSSKTKYLLWINRAYQHVNVFEGAKGNWKLIKSFVVGTGAAGSPTPVGVTTVSYKQAGGWTTGSYTVRPVVGFYPGTGYAFHSRLSYPGTDKEYDFSAGYPVSHGCVRMYKNDIRWIYNNIPVGTTVVIF